MVNSTILQQRFPEGVFWLCIFVAAVCSLRFVAVGLWGFFPLETSTHIGKRLSKLPSLKAAASLNSERDCRLATPSPSPNRADSPSVETSTPCANDRNRLIFFFF